MLLFLPKTESSPPSMPPQISSMRYMYVYTAGSYSRAFVESDNLSLNERVPNFYPAYLLDLYGWKGELRRVDRALTGLGIKPTLSLLCLKNTLLDVLLAVVWCYHIWVCILCSFPFQGTRQPPVPIPPRGSQGQTSSHYQPLRPVTKESSHSTYEVSHMS